MHANAIALLQFFKRLSKSQVKLIRNAISL